MALPININDVSEDALHLKDLMDGVLERVCSTFQSYNVPLPDRRYWTLGGQTVVDCEQLVVSLVQMYLGVPGDEAASPQRCHVPRSASLSILLSRKIPTVGQNGKPPSGDKIEEASYISAIDAWVLMESINQLDQWDTTGYGLGVIATLDVVGPEGGFQSTNLTLTMAVP